MTQLGPLLQGRNGHRLHRLPAPFGADTEPRSLVAAGPSHLRGAPMAADARAPRTLEESDMIKQLWQRAKRALGLRDVPAYCECNGCRPVLCHCGELALHETLDAWDPAERGWSRIVRLRCAGDVCILNIILSDVPFERDPPLEFNPAMWKMV